MELKEGYNEKDEVKVRKLSSPFMWKCEMQKYRLIL